MKSFKESEFLDDLLVYYDKALKLQQNQFNYANHIIDDPLMNHVPIYNNVQRRYAGFSNVLEAIWYGSDAPKGARPEFDHLKREWSHLEWMYAFLIHRVTGSGASFESDHGWRNTPIPAITDALDMVQMSELLAVRFFEGPCFTSIGNQPPQFKKITNSYDYKPGQYYLLLSAPMLVMNLYEWLIASNTPKSVVQVVDWMNDQNLKSGMKRFTFVYTAFAMDLAEYLPELVDPWSEVYAGSNALKCMQLVFPRQKKATEVKYVNEVLFHVCEMFSEIAGEKLTKPMCAEDVLCDLVRYLCEYKAPQYKTLEPHQKVNNAPSKYRLGHSEYYSTLTKYMNKYGIEFK